MTQASHEKENCKAAEATSQEARLREQPSAHILEHLPLRRAESEQECSLATLHSAFHFQPRPLLLRQAHGDAQDLFQLLAAAAASPVPAAAAAAPSRANADAGVKNISQMPHWQHAPCLM